MSWMQSNVDTNETLWSAGSGESRGSMNLALVTPAATRFVSARSRAKREMS